MILRYKPVTYKYLLCILLYPLNSIHIHKYILQPEAINIFLNVHIFFLTPLTSVESPIDKSFL